MKETMDKLNTRHDEVYGMDMEEEVWASRRYAIRARKCENVRKERARLTVVHLSKAMCFYRHTGNSVFCEKF